MSGFYTFALALVFWHRAIASGRLPTTEERKWGVLVGAYPRQNTPNTLFTELRMPQVYNHTLG